MKKSEQAIVNSIVEIAEKNAFSLFNSSENKGGVKFHNMNAKIFSIGDAKILVSYDTIVAIVQDKVGYDFMRKNFFFKKSTASYPNAEECTNFSSATARQISRFFSEYAVKTYTYREI